jgi:hypothetical protein
MDNVKIRNQIDAAVLDGILQISSFFRHNGDDMVYINSDCGETILFNYSKGLIISITALNKLV